ncbi:MAG TPA: VOC family protein [Candidatus Limnocylindrales bacterium]|nr:VOC family protein [Candidatus Limnocylindrales bacterium]
MSENERDPELLLPSEFIAAGGVDDWRMDSEGVGAVFRTGSFAEGAAFAARLGGIAGIEPWMPDVDLRHDRVFVRVTHVSAEWFGPSRKGLEICRAVSAIAGEMGLQPAPADVQAFLFIVEALDIPKVMPFWEAVLGYVRRPDSPDEDLMPPGGRGPFVWFEQLDKPRDERNTMHVAVWVAPEVAEARVAAALAAGGSIVRDQFAPAWWTLADPEGNEADIATVQGRG